MTVLLVVGGLALVGAAIMWSRYLFRTPQSATLSRHGLRILHGEETIGEVPGAAIREFILAETTGGVFELRMRYDQEAVPQLPPAVRKFCERCGMQSEEILRAIGRPLSPSTIPLGAVGGSRFTPLTMEKVFRIRRLVESTGMAEWHRISDQ